VCVQRKRVCTHKITQACAFSSVMHMCQHSQKHASMCVQRKRVCKYKSTQACVFSSVMHMCRVGQDRTYTPYMTVYLVISQPNIPYLLRIYSVLANPTYVSALKSARKCVRTVAQWFNAKVLALTKA
jgi:hypothetical protein